jgi:hypothetical protein
MIDMGNETELPADVIVHSRLVLTRKAGDAVLREIKSGKANEALRKLMRAGD